MECISLKNGCPYSLRGTDRIACAVGNFDGVHTGHQALLTATTAKPDGATHSAVWTFRTPSSAALFAGTRLITSPEERLAFFRQMGIDLVFTEDFEAVREQTPADFAAMLWEKCRVRVALCGYNFRFGKDAGGTPEMLSAFFAERGGSVLILPPVEKRGIAVSASEIRALIAAGDVAAAAELLGRPYTLTAPVLHGQALGRSLGFPTANQHFPANRVLPKAGVYMAEVTVDGKNYRGIADIGTRPTVQKGDDVACETYLFDFSGDLYGKTVTTAFLDFLRPEKRFADLDALRRAVSDDTAEAKWRFAAWDARV